jgi:hypothetical protein
MVTNQNSESEIEGSDFQKIDQQRSKNQENYLILSISLSVEHHKFAELIAKLTNKKIQQILAGYIYRFLYHLEFESDGQIARYVQDVLESEGRTGADSPVCEKCFVWRVCIGNRVIDIMNKVTDPDTFFSAFLRHELELNLTDKNFLLSVLKNQSLSSNSQIVNAVSEFLNK